MSKKNPEKVKSIYVQVDSHESDGGEGRSFDDGPYSGFSHTQIEISSVGPVFYSENGISYHSHQANEYDEKIHWANLADCTAYVVISRYSDGGTFGRTDGRFTIEFVTTDIQRAKDWAKENHERIRRENTGYFERFESLDCESVKFISNPKNIIDGKSKNWWES